MSDLTNQLRQRNTEMKERPIIFSGTMVRSILDGRKTQTRRVIKPQPSKSMFWAKLNVDDWAWPHQGQPHRITISNNPCGPDGYSSECPYGSPGDIMWVREEITILSFGASCAHIRYNADGKTAVVCDSKLPNRCKIVTSIHMPRNVSRLTLEITDVRVQPLQKLSWFDAVAEGMNDPRRASIRIDDSNCKSPRHQFKNTWDTINKNPGHTWDDNPWVWVITFRRLPVEGLR